MEAILAVMNITQWWKKKTQACTGFEPMTFMIPVQRSTNWS